MRKSFVLLAVAVAAMAATAVARAAPQSAWQLPPQGYAYEQSKGCPPPAGRTLIYRVCEDQMALFKAGLEKAKAEKKLLLVTFGATWCPSCNALHRQMPSEQILGFKGDNFDYGRAFVPIEIGASMTAEGRNTKVPSGEAVLRHVLAKAPDNQFRGWPFFAVIDPSNADKVYVRNTEDLGSKVPGDPGADVAKVRRVLREGHDVMRMGRKADAEPQRGVFARIYRAVVGEQFR